MLAIKYNNVVYELVIERSLIESIETYFAHLMEEVDPDSLGFFIDSQGIEKDWDFEMPPLEEMFGYVINTAGVDNIDTAGVDNIDTAGVDNIDTAGVC